MGEQVAMRATGTTLYAGMYKMKGRCWGISSGVQCSGIVLIGMLDLDRIHTGYTGSVDRSIDTQTRWIDRWLDWIDRARGFHE
jgi:hypothetical protein